MCGNNEHADNREAESELNSIKLSLGHTAGGCIALPLALPDPRTTRFLRLLNGMNPPVPEVTVLIPTDHEGSALEALAACDKLRFADSHAHPSASCCITFTMSRNSASSG